MGDGILIMIAMHKQIKIKIINFYYIIFSQYRILRKNSVEEIM